MKQSEPLRKEHDIMKANLKKFLGLAALGMTLLATTVPTWAGRVSTDSVIIGNNQVSSWASGNPVDARYSTDNRQNIGCKAQILSSYSWTTCYAMNSAGRSLVCGSGDWKFLEVLHGMTDSSFIYFTTDNNSNGGTCTHISVYNGSDMLR
jgi:hypothetical protein